MKIKRPDSVFPSLPSGMDRVLKNYFDEFMYKGELPPELKSNLECLGCKLFGDVEKLRMWRNNFEGISWTDSDGNILHGAVDNLLVKENKIIVLDYKTRGFPLKENTHEHYQQQLNIYNYLLRKNGYETEDYAFLIFYIPKKIKETGEVIFDKHLIKVKIDVNEAERYWRKALKILEGPCPKDNGKQEQCKWCKMIECD